MLLQLTINGIVLGIMYAVMACGFALIYNTSRIFHVAHGATYAASAFVCYFTLVKLHVSLPVAILISVVAAMLLGILMEVFLYRPLRFGNATLLVMLISSLGFYIVVVNILAMCFGSETLLLLADSRKAYEFVGIRLTDTQLWQIGAGLVVLPLTVILLNYSRLGRCIRAVRDDSSLLETMGVSSSWLYLRVFVLGSALTGLASILIALDSGIDPNIGMGALLIAAAAVIIGGAKTFSGPVVGGILLGLLQGFISWKTSARWGDAALFAILVVFLFCRPQGLLGVRHRLEEVSD